MVKIHFLNVGHGDCTIIEHESGHITMLDINNGDALDEDTRKELAAVYGITGNDYAVKAAVADSIHIPFRKLYLAKAGYEIELTDPVAYYKARFGTNDIFRLVITHPDLDHMRGLVRLKQEKIGILNLWDTDHNKALTQFTGSDEEEWKEYLRLRNSSEAPKVFRHFRGAENKYWNQDDLGGTGDGLYILAPTPELRDAANEADDINAHSYVIWLQYGGCRVVLGGDATEPVWQSIFDKYGAHLKCDILKASHHGRASGYHGDAVAAMNPDYTIVSVGKKPETDASNNYRYHTEKGVWSTRWHGNITVTVQANGSYLIESDKTRKDLQNTFAALLGVRRAA